MEPIILTDAQNVWLLVVVIHALGSMLMLMLLKSEKIYLSNSDFEKIAIAFVCCFWEIFVTLGILLSLISDWREWPNSPK